MLWVPTKITAISHVQRIRYISQGYQITWQKIQRSLFTHPDQPNLEFSEACDAMLCNQFFKSFEVLPDFVNAVEEEQLMAELTPKLKRMRYQFDHWDDAIHGYRETEKLVWNKSNLTVLDRLRQRVFTSGAEVMQHVHVLDLEESGHIKPHVDSIKVCTN